MSTINPEHIATYRGVRYDTDQHKADYVAWWNRIHCDATRWFTYRGHAYRAYDQCAIGDKLC